VTAASEKWLQSIRDAQDAYDDAHPAEPLGCPTCLASRADLPPQKEDHSAALLAALQDVLDASTELAATESVPRKLWLALKRADDVRADVLGLPF
jgi:hypothetical protein